jgi:hypothetical protein
MSEPKLYYDIEYEATANFSGVQRVWLKDIGHDEFSVEAEDAAVEEVELNPDCEGELLDGWDYEPNSFELYDAEEGTTEYTCCICENMFPDVLHSHNPDLHDKEHKYKWGQRCCSNCNTNVVIPTRIMNLKKSPEEGGLWQ